MRLWSIHPKYLDSKGLVALWREALLAQKVLEGKTKGYTLHPQLERFRNSDNKLNVIGCYLLHVYREAKQRGYNFNKKKIIKFYDCKSSIPITKGQLNYEFDHLKKKLKRRDIETYEQIVLIENIEPHPIFEVLEGDIEAWEKMQDLDGEKLPSG
ncbi:MAG: hypothetical protein HGN29_16735 [Asgard group archaeon]|nr:hypothetical protein [Asgard group archaeon]